MTRFPGYPIYPRKFLLVAQYRRSDTYLSNNYYGVLLMLHNLSQCSTCSLQYSGPISYMELDVL